MVWRRISAGGSTDLHIIWSDGSKKCRQDPKTSYRTLHCAIGGSFLLMQNITIPHTARLMENFFEAENNTAYAEASMLS
ncbi:hypothetical protein TNCV_2876731 [Trichonephila clavipes]|uniref:Uncharacterized protein n=1 Tax=Trichonephila clavipes TaxID=2585209 RepID=A0A8X6WEI6_TRICX|nr:hypothetical protein TNCV_2876731 [Trichonephila clavipes]